jgi:hypothetical protein|eukprot:COSAG06_NODE_6186_length_3060_cov_2.881121_2_plen_209_part_00
MRCSPRARRRRSRLSGCVQGARAGQKKTGDLGARSCKARAGRRHRSIILPLIREQVVHTAKLQMRHAREPLAAQQHQTSRGTFSYKYGERAAAPLDRPSARSRGCGRSFAPLHHVPCRGGARSISVQQCTRNSLCVYNVVLPLLLRWLSCCSCCVGCVFSGGSGRQPPCGTVEVTISTVQNEQFPVLCVPMSVSVSFTTPFGRPAGAA